AKWFFSHHTRYAIPPPPGNFRGPGGIGEIGMTDALAKSVSTKQVEVAQAKARLPLEACREQALASPEPRNVFAAVTKPARQLRVIAEVKKASPSAGVIRPDFDPVAIAQAYHA